MPPETGAGWRMRNGLMKRALVFDDEPDIRQMFHLLLECCGYEVHSFEDPSDYCKLDSDGCPLAGSVCCADVLISDLKMPRVDGLSFMQAIAAKHCRIPARALMSGYWTPSSLELAHQLGCHTFAKPMKVDTIFNWLAECEARSAQTVREMPVNCSSSLPAFA